MAFCSLLLSVLCLVVYSNGAGQPVHFYPQWLVLSCPVREDKRPHCDITTPVRAPVSQNRWIGKEGDAAVFAKAAAYRKTGSLIPKAFFILIFVLFLICFWIKFVCFYVSWWLSGLFLYDLVVTTDLCAISFSLFCILFISLVNFTFRAFRFHYSSILGKPCCFVLSILSVFFVLFTIPDLFVFSIVRLCGLAQRGWSPVAVYQAQQSPVPVGIRIALLDVHNHQWQLDLVVKTVTEHAHPVLHIPCELFGCWRHETVTVLKARPVCMSSKTSVEVDETFWLKSPAIRNGEDRMWGRCIVYVKCAYYGRLYPA